MMSFPYVYVITVWIYLVCMRYTSYYAARLLGYVYEIARTVRGKIDDGFMRRSTLREP